MPAIALITDTDSSLPLDITEKLNIVQVPITLHLNGESYQACVDLDDRAMFQKIEASGDYPTTAAPSPDAFLQAFQRAIADGAESIICICVSSEVSATYNAAVMAADMLEHDIRIVDSMELSLGQGFIVLEAAEAIQNGASVDEVLTHIAGLEQKIHTFALLPSLKFVALSGRLSKVSANIGDTLNIKPILTVQGGKLEVVSKQRTLKKALGKMLEMNREALAGKAVKRLAFIHTDNLDGAKTLAHTVAPDLPSTHPVFYAEFTPGLSVHTGPGVVGIAALTE
ncbi:MAG: DegV family protein [Anaerolineales bacterium]|nr:DegV family protein [Anaerolineales bacterium]